MFLWAFFDKSNITKYIYKLKEFRERLMKYKMVFSVLFTSVVPEYELESKINASWNVPG